MVELLVMLAILALLAALSFPAVQWAREASRRAACSGNLRQQLMALDQYHVDHGSYPYGASAGWGFDWRTHLLPFMEQPALAADVPWGDSGSWAGKGRRSANLIVLARTSLALMRCPSQQKGVWEVRSINGIAGRAISSFSGNAGSNVTVDTINDARSDMRFGNGPLRVVEMLRGGMNPVRREQILDGLGNTVLIAEVRHRIDDVCGVCDRFSLYHPDFDSGGGTDFSESLGSTRYAINDDGSENRRELSFGSFHPGGCSVGYADGSCRFVADGIDLKVWRSHGSMHSGD